MTSLTLQDLVNVDTLQEIQDRFADATGLGVVIADQDGTPVTQPSNFTNFCTLIRSSPKGMRSCILSDERVGMMAAQQGRPVIHRCHSGLVDLAAPIIVDERYLGSVLCGQVLIEDVDEEGLDSIRSKTNQIPVDQKQLTAYFRQIGFKTQKRVEAAAEMLYLVANYIVKIGATHLAQQELFAKRQKLLEESEIRARLEKTLKETQLKVLQSQINPHFLFNTLNTISRLAYLEGADQTQNVTYSLAKILRYSLRNIDQLVYLRDELEHVKQYLSIQQSRFPGRIHYRERLEAGSDLVKIPILCLQPIFENAVVHGFEPKEGNMTITVTTFTKNENVIIEVDDDGAGMTAEEVKSILSEDKPQGSGHTTGIGLKNVHKRIQHYLGEEYGITSITSRLGAHTTVQITVPKTGGANIEADDRG